MVFQFCELAGIDSCFLSVFKFVNDAILELFASAATDGRNTSQRNISCLNVGADLLLTGDKDFLESSIEDPRIISVRSFLEMDRLGFIQLGC